MPKKNKSKNSRQRSNTLFLPALVLVGLLFAAFLLRYLYFGNTDYKALKKIKIVASFPVGVNTADSSMKSIRLALAERNNKVGSFEVELVELDDGDENGVWKADKEKINAEIAANDPTVVAYIGPQNSGAAKVSMPILNKAGITQISPSNTWPGLTKSGFAPGEPAIFYPSGTRHYFRVVTTDDLQGPAAAIWAKELGYSSVYVIDDGESYGKGIGDLFRNKSSELGLNVLGHESINPRETNYRALVNKIASKNVDLVYFGGSLNNGITFIVPQLKNAGYQGKFMGPDALLDQDLIEILGSNAENFYVTSVGVPVKNLDTAKAKKFAELYKKTYSVEPELFGATAYEATQVLLAAIENSDGSKEDIARQIKSIKNFDSMFGPISFDQNGDIEQKTISANVVSKKAFSFVKKLELP